MDAYSTVNLVDSFKKSDSTSSEFYTKDEIDYLWKFIQGNYYQSSENDWLLLSPYDYEQTIPNDLKVYKKKYSSLRSDVRYCSADLCLGFFNSSENPLTLTLKHFVGVVSSFQTIHVPPKSKSSLKNPIWFSKDPFSTFRISEPSHEDFYILYGWFPKRNKRVKPLPHDLLF